MPERGQQTLTGPKQTALDRIAEPEPLDEDGVRQVLVTKKYNCRNSYHRQDPHNAGETACWHSAEWVEKPKAAMERSSATPCPLCYPDGDEEAETDV